MEDECFSKWRNLAVFWREFEFDVSADDLTKMLDEFATLVGRQ
jgi:hypothetical protein